MLPPPAPTFRAPTRESVLLQMGTRPSSLTTEEDLSFMDAEVRTVFCSRHGHYGPLCSWACRVAAQARLVRAVLPSSVSPAVVWLCFCQVATRLWEVVGDVELT